MWDIVKVDCGHDVHFVCFVISFHCFRTAILLVNSTHRFVSSSRVRIKLKSPKSKNFRLESSCQFDDSSAGFFVLLRVRLVTDHIGSPSFVILTFRRFVMAFGRFDSSTKAPSTRIRIFLNLRHFFFPDSKISMSTRSVLKSNLPECLSTRIRWYPDSF